MEHLQHSVENLIGSDINRASIILRKKLTDLFKKHKIDLTPEEFALLSRVWENEGILQNHLVEKTLKDKTRVTRLLNNLSDKGFIYRKINDKDKRKQFIFLTNEGKDLQSTIMPIVDHLMTRVSKDIDPKEIEITQRVLKQIFF